MPTPTSKRLSSNRVTEKYPPLRWNKEEQGVLHDYFDNENTKPTSKQKDALASQLLDMQQGHGMSRGAREGALEQRAVLSFACRHIINPLLKMQGLRKQAKGQKSLKGLDTDAPNDSSTEGPADSTSSKVDPMSGKSNKTIAVRTIRSLPEECLLGPATTQLAQPVTRSINIQTVFRRSNAWGDATKFESEAPGRTGNLQRPDMYRQNSSSTYSSTIPTSTSYSSWGFDSGHNDSLSAHVVDPQDSEDDENIEIEEAEGYYGT
ncbi:hypothetical protein M422DRAFT_245657 [Sphaerobolus stellatus SS14]|nr:hypothetical protein M422DRAFT_245657 [Sphaerobolus stellatus SS14]